MKTIKAEETQDKNVIHKVDEQAQEESIVEVRGAIISPDRLINTPGYYLLLGKGKESSEPIFLKEAEASSEEALFSKLVDDEENLRFHTLYAEFPFKFKLGEAIPDFVLQLLKHQKKHIPWVRTCPVSIFYGNDIKEGVHLLYQWGGRSAVPEGTTLRNQLGKITPDNFEDTAFYAFTALRYLLGGFKRDSVSFIENVARRREKALRKDRRKKLTGADRAAADEFYRICRRLKDEDDWSEDDWEDDY